MNLCKQAKATCYNRLTRLPLGSVTASGWLKDQLLRSKEGMGGHLGELEPHLIGKPLTTGQLEEKMNPRLRAGWCGEISSTYWNGLIELAFTLRDNDLITMAGEWVDGVLNRQREDGYIGTYREKEHDIYDDYNAWSTALLLRALLCYYEATEREDVLHAVHRALLWFVENWTKFSFYAGPGLIEPTLAVYILTGDNRLLEYALAFEEWLNQNTLWPNSTKIFQKGHADFNSMHAVAYGIDVILPALLHSAVNAPEKLNASRIGLESLIQNCMMPHGGISSNFEYLSPKVTNHETEYCNFTVYAYTFSSMAMVTGKAHYGDLVERIVFNGAQGARKKDEKAIAYMSAGNQLFATKRSSSFGPEEDMMVYAPNYPIACCPAHSVRIMPEFVRHMCMTDEQNNLYFITYGPCHISYEGISLHVTTEYPFRDTIHFQFENTSGKSFTLFLRVPDWCSEPSLLVNGCKHSAEVNADGFLEIDGIWEPSDSITLQLPMKVHTSVLSDNNHKHPVFIERGPLVFSKKIDFMWYETQERGYTPLPEGWHWYEASANVNFLHHEAQKAFDFNYALTGKKLDQITVTETAYTYPWEEAPIVLQITAEKAKHMFPPYPIKTHDLYQNPTDTDGIETQIELVPYGCTNLRITYFPTAVSKEDVSL